MRGGGFVGSERKPSASWISCGGVDIASISVRNFSWDTNLVEVDSAEEPVKT
jgi:hypothetical protein